LERNCRDAKSQRSKGHQTKQTKQFGGLKKKKFWEAGLGEEGGGKKTRPALRKPSLLQNRKRKLSIGGGRSQLRGRKKKTILILVSES